VVGTIGSQTVSTDVVCAISGLTVCANMVGTIGSEAVSTDVVCAISGLTVCANVVRTIGSEAVCTDVVCTISSLTVCANVVRTIRSLAIVAQVAGVGVGRTAFGDNSRVQQSVCVHSRKREGTRGQDREGKAEDQFGFHSRCSKNHRVVHSV